jgi:endonuclease YncB( thermonuclease family)
LDAPIARTTNNTFTLCAKVMKLNCVIDGDTIRYGGEKIRLMDIDAPEVHEPKCASEKALGDRATLRLLELMNAGPFTVVRVGHRDATNTGANFASSNATAGRLPRL